MACISKRRGRWVIDFYDQYGKRRWETLKKGTTKQRAKERLREIEENVSRGIYMPPDKVPLFSQVAEEWLEYKKPKIRIGTWIDYARQVKIHLGEFERVRINRITIANVERFITKRQRQGMNINTLRRALVTLNQIMNYAVRHRYIDFNPVREAESPKSTGNDADNGKDIKILTPEQINALLEAVEDPKYRTLIRLAVFSGARQGEILGLKWSDVDWENNQIHIQRTYNHGRFFSPKSKNSNRRIDLGPATMRELKKWKLTCPGNELDLVFPSKAGTPIDHHHMVSRVFEPALKAAGLPKIRFHDLRHTLCKHVDSPGGEYQIHSESAWALVTDGYVGCLCSLDEKEESRGGIETGKDNF